MRTPAPTEMLLFFSPYFVLLPCTRFYFPVFIITYNSFFHKKRDAQSEPLYVSFFSSIYTRPSKSDYNYLLFVVLLAAVVVVVVVSVEDVVVVYLNLISFHRSWSIDFVSSQSLSADFVHFL